MHAQSIVACPRVLRSLIIVHMHPYDWAAHIVGQPIWLGKQSNLTLLVCVPQVAGLQSETAQKVLSLPAAPGSLAVNTAASLHGIMVSKLFPCCACLQCSVSL